MARFRCVLTASLALAACVGGRAAVGQVPLPPSVEEIGQTPGDQDLADQAFRLPDEGRGRSAFFSDTPDPSLDIDTDLSPDPGGGATTPGDELEDLVERLDQIERRLGGGATSGGGSRGGSILTPPGSLDVFGDASPAGSLQETFAALEEDFVSSVAGGVRRGTSGATAKLFGRVHLDYWSFPEADEGAAVLENVAGTPTDPQDRFLFRRLRLGVGGDIREGLFYKAELEMPDPNDLQMRDVFLGFREVPGLLPGLVPGTRALVVGNMKRPLGLDHLNSSRFTLFLERSLVTSAFNNGVRRLGAQVLGVSDDLAWNWRYGLFTLENIQDDGSYTGDSYQLQAAGRLAHTYFYDEATEGRRYGHLALAAAVADPNADGPLYENQARFLTRPEIRTRNRWLDTGGIVGADVFALLAGEHVLNLGPLQWTSEVQAAQVGRSDVGGPAREEATFWGATTFVNYYLTGEHIPWNREAGTIGRVRPQRNFIAGRDECGRHRGGPGAWSVGLRYSYLDLVDDDVRGGRGANLTLALNWHWNPNAKLQVNWVHGQVHESAAAGPPVDARYDSLGTRLAFDF